MENLAKLTISQFQRLLLAKKISSVEAAKFFLERIQKIDPKIKAFLTVTEERALDDASKADKHMHVLGKSAFSKYPLLAVPVAHKDLFLTEGLKTTAGSKVLENYIPQYSATVVSKLEEAGTILLGKLNCDAWAHGASGENSDFFPTKNPWNLDYVAGGSSSGSAASVSAGLTMIATGTDTGGSVRLPASFCSVVGLKPTYGRVSRYGVVAMASSLDSIGHITNTVLDSERVLAITEGKDGYDSIMPTFKKIKTPEIGKIRIGLPKEYFGEGVDGEVIESVHRASRVFEKMGAKLTEVSLPNSSNAIEAYYIITPSEISSNLARYDGVRYGSGRETFGDEAKRRIMIGTFSLSSGYQDKYYKKALEVKNFIENDFNKVFAPSPGGVDAIISPVSPTPAFKLGEKVDDPVKMYLSDVFTVSANLAGIPGLSLPSGFSKAGLPIGFQILGPKFSEETLFELGKIYQEETDWHESSPNL